MQIKPTDPPIAPPKTAAFDSADSSSVSDVSSSDPVSKSSIQ